MSEVPEDYLTFTLEVAVHVDDIEAIDFLRGIADEGSIALPLAGPGDDQIGLMIVDVKTTREQDDAIGEYYGIERGEDD